MEGQESFYAKLLMLNVALCEERGISWNLWTYKDARRMGIVVPSENSDWIRLRRRVEACWSHEWEQKVSMEVTRSIGETYYRPLDDTLAYVLDFRIRSVLHRIAVEQILKPALREIPWEEMKRYPDGFAFANCEKRETIVDTIKHYIQTKEEESV